MRSSQAAKQIPNSLIPVGVPLFLAAETITGIAHWAGPVSPEELWQAWNLDPLIGFGVMFTAWLYVRGLGALWHRAGVGRGVQQWQVAAFVAGLLTLVIALISPLDALSSTLFSAHMTQHLLLILIAPPLLILGMPPALFAWSLPQGWRPNLNNWWQQQKLLRGLWSIISRPVVVWVAHAIAVWAWHMPGLYQAAVDNAFIHFLEHFSFLVTALLFWWVIIHPGGARNLHYGGKILFVFTTALYSGVLGALITFSPQVWYPIYEGRTALWGLSTLEDQQLAGVIMWVPAGVIYVVTALVLLGMWLQRMDQNDQRRKGATVPKTPLPGSTTR